MSTSKKFLITLLALSAIAVAAVGASFSAFTATPVTIASQAFANGSLAMSASTSAIFTIHDAVVGSSTTGSITISDIGTIPANFSLTGSTDSGSDANLASILTMQIYKDVDLTSTPIYSGLVSTFAALPTGGLALGTFQKAGTAGDNHTYYFHVELPSTGSTAGDNALQAKTVSSTFSWNAVQS
jgi:spore coat-associated protein N